MGAPVTALVASSILIAAFSRQLADEFKAWTPWLVRKLIAHAVRRLPVDRRERYGEEWSSHVEEIPGEIGKILVTLSLFWAAIRIGHMFRGEKTGARPTGISFKRRSLLTIYAFCIEKFPVNSSQPNGSSNHFPVARNASVVSH
jgi:hypothetical protein